MKKSKYMYKLNAYTYKKDKLNGVVQIMKSFDEVKKKLNEKK